MLDTEQNYHDIKRILNNFKNLKLTYSDAIEKIQEIITSTRNQVIQEIEEKLPENINLGVDCKISVEDFAKSWNDCLYKLKSLLNSMRK